MRIVHGAEAAREALAKGRRLDLASVPSSFLDTTERVFGERLSPVETVSRIIDSVRSEGDRAVRHLTASLEGKEYQRIEVADSDLETAAGSVDPRVVDAFTHAADRIRRFHEAAKPRDWMDFSAGYGCISRACDSVGIYVPGGSVPLPSTVLMTAIPARVAGVRDVILCSPAAKDGLPDPTVLAAARIADVDRVFAIGGAQAVAAMAYGTETVPSVDMVCGPGNVFVTLAKKLVYGDVGIDGLYGPTETLIVADHTANPTLCAADLLAQAEHDPMARPVLLCTSESLANSVSGEVDARTAKARPRLDCSRLDRRAGVYCGNRRLGGRHRDRQLVRARAHVPQRRRPLVVGGQRQERGRALHRRLFPRSPGRLRRRPQPRNAHVRHRQVQLRRRRAHVLEDDPGYSPRR